MRILIFHGYLLAGTGSNVYNASLAEHTAVFEAIIARDSTGARRAMADLLGMTRSRIEG